MVTECEFLAAKQHCMTGWKKFSVQLNKETMKEHFHSHLSLCAYR